MWSIQTYHQAGPDAWSVSSPVGGGSIYDDVRSVAILDVATTLPVNTRQPMRPRRVTLSSVVLSRARTGIGTTERTNTPRGHLSHPRSIIPSTNQCLVRLERFPATGGTFWSDSQDEVSQRSSAQVTFGQPARKWQHYVAALAGYL
jgi:hypothetical protein